MTLLCQPSHLNWELITISGIDRQPWLQGLVTCDLTQLGDHDVQLALFCNAKGRVLMNGWLWSDSTRYYLLLPFSQIDAALTHLKKYALFSKIQLEMQPDILVHLYMLDNTHHQTTAVDLPKTVQTWCKYNDGFLFRWPGHPTRLCVVGLANPLPGLDQPSTLPEDHGALDIAQKLCWVIPEIAGQFTPHMLGLNRWNAISFKKGCYLGQEIIARTEHLGKLKRHLHMGHITGQTSLSNTEQTPQLKIGDPLIDNTLKQPLGYIVALALTSNHDIALLAVVEDRAFSSSATLTTQHNLPIIWQ